MPFTPDDNSAAPAPAPAAIDWLSSAGLQRAAWTLLVGLVGGLAALAAGAPLPWLSGPLVAVAAMAVARAPEARGAVGFPHRLRLYVVPIIGVSIGAAVTPDIVRAAPGWWPTLLTLAVFVPLAHRLNYFIYRRGGLPEKTAFFAALPGGLLEAIALTERRGGDVQLVTFLQFSRIILCVLLIPIGFALFGGVAVGSSAGAEFEGADKALSLWDVVVLVLSGVIGFVGARRLRLPAAPIVGPMLVSGAAHASGLVVGAPPTVLVSAAQFLIGVSLGARFVGMGRDLLARAAKLSIAAFGASMALCVLLAAALAGPAGEQPMAVVLAFAPGGLVEMSLIAVSLELSVVYVVAHHIGRILLSVFYGVWAAPPADPPSS